MSKSVVRRHLTGTLRALVLVLVLGIPSFLWAAKTPSDVSPAAVDLNRIDALVKGGAPHLALRMVERHQPANAADPIWAAWERRRLQIYESLSDWQAVAARVEALPAGVPPTFRQEALLSAAEARLHAKDPSGARRFLRRLLWQADVSPAAAARARRFVIRSYLLEGNLDDAQLALVRYQQDFKARSDDWQALQGEILLRQGRAKAAYSALAGVQSYEARLMRYAAGLRAGLRKPQDVMAESERLGAGLKAHPAIRAQAWLVVAEAAEKAGDRTTRVRALELALSVPDTSASFIARASADDLWRAYDGLAEAIGNQSRLVIGNDAQWAKHIKSIAKKHPERARAMYGFLTRRARSEAMRLQSHEALTGALLENELGETAKVLYTESSRYPQVSAIPHYVRYRLADRALGLFDIKLAAEMIGGLDTPPRKEDADLWDLRRARVLLYAGDVRAAVTVLSNVLPRHPVMADDFAEAYSQVLFELQAIDHHREAVVLFESIYARVRNERIRRELLYWIADSKTALGDHQEAAELYLRSATYNGATGGDMWGQTARFHAAQALGKAGLVNDARAVYERLLRGTTDPQRRAVIERNLQQLWLAEQQKRMTP